MEIVNKILAIFALVFAVFCMVIVVVEFSTRRYMPEKKVKAQVCDKYESRGVTRYPGSFNPVIYRVVFQVGKHKLSFNVDHSSYVNYKVGKKGTLTYRGGRLINFK